MNLDELWNQSAAVEGQNKGSSNGLLDALWNNSQAPANEQPASIDNPGSHPTYSAPIYNLNPFTALAKGAYEGGSDVVSTINKLREKMPGQAPLGPTIPNPLFNGLRNTPEARPGTGAGIAEDIGKGVVSGAPIMAGGMFGPIGMGAVGGIEAYANNQDVPKAVVQNALLGKLWQLTGSMGSGAFVNAAKKFGIPEEVASKEFLQRTGSALGSGVGGAAISQGDPASIAQGATFGALYPSEPFKKSDVLPFGNHVAYALMKDYMMPWAKDFKYMHDPIRGWLNEGLTANNIGDAAKAAADRKAEIGQHISQTIENSSNSGETRDYSGVLKPIDEQIAQLNKSPKSNASAITRLQDAKDDLTGTLSGKTNLTPQEAFDFKQQVDDLTKWTGNPGDDKPINRALQDVYRSIRNNLNDQIPELKDFNQRYGDMSEAVKRLQYRSSASNPLLHIGKGAWDLGLAAIMGHGNPLATAGIAAAEQVMRSGAVKTRLANALYTRPEFAGVPKAATKASPLALAYNPLPIPDYLKSRTDIPSQKIPPSGPMRPIPNESGIEQFSVPKEGEPIEQRGISARASSQSFAKGADLSPEEMKKQVSENINQYWLGKIMGPFNPLNKINNEKGFLRIGDDPRQFSKEELESSLGHYQRMAAWAKGNSDQSQSKDAETMIQKIQNALNGVGKAAAPAALAGSLIFSNQANAQSDAKTIKNAMLEATLATEGLEKGQTPLKYSTAAMKEWNTIHGISIDKNAKPSKGRGNFIYVSPDKVNDVINAQYQRYIEDPEHYGLNENSTAADLFSKFDQSNPKSKIDYFTKHGIDANSIKIKDLK